MALGVGVGPLEGKAEAVKMSSAIRRVMRGRSMEEQSFRAGMVLGAAYMYGRLGGSSEDLEAEMVMPPDEIMDAQWAQWAKPRAKEGKVSSVGEEYPKEQARVRELIEVYRGLGPQGAFAMAMLKDVLREADEAAISGDAVRIIRSFARMQGCK